MKLTRLLFCTLFLTAFVGLKSFGQTTCQFTLNLYDAFGDGWFSGSEIYISLDGAAATTYTIAPNTMGTGLSASFPIDVKTGQTLELGFTMVGFDGYEASWELLDNNGDIVTSQAQDNVFGLSSGVYFKNTVGCANCVGPKNVQVANVYAYTAKVKWASTEPGTFRVVYGTAGFDLAAGKGDTITTTQYKATIPGLYENTPYEFYVWRDCPNNAGPSPVVGPISFKTYFSDDVGISRVVSPVSDCSLSSNEKVTVQLKNHGANPQSLVAFYFSVDGVPASISIPDDGYYTGVLGKDSCEYIQFDATADVSGPGQHIIRAWTELTGDDNSSNDTLVYYLTNKVGLPYEQDFENWTGGWYPDTSKLSTWAYGTPNKATLKAAANGQNCWVTSLTGTYNNSEMSYLYSPCLDFSSNTTTDPTIRFSIWYNIEQNYDGAFLDMSFDDGATWSRVGTVAAAGNWYDETNLFSSLGDVWSGNSGGWITARHKLDGAKGKPNVRLRFGFGSDPFVNFYDGVAIDGIHIFIQQQKDLAAVSASVNSTADCGIANDKLTFVYRNEGATAQSNVKLAFQYDNQAIVTENAPGSIAAGVEKTYTFTKTVSSIGGPHVVKVWTVLNGDQNVANDTTRITFGSFPNMLPLKEDFETKVLPVGWSTDPSTLVTNGHNAPSYVLARNLYDFNPTSYIELPAFGPVSAGDSLTFDYRIVDYTFDQTTNGTEPTFLGTDNFQVQVSTNCGQTFTTAYTIDASNQSASASMTKVKIDLTPYDGKIVKFQIVGEWGQGDYWFDTDNYNIKGCPENFGLHVEVNTDANPTQSLGSATITPKFGSAPFTYKWPGGLTGPTQVGLPNGGYFVTVTDHNGCTDVAYVEIETPSATNDLPNLTRFSLQPNPTTGQTALVLEFENPTDARIEVLNLLGQPIFSTLENSATSLRRSLDLSHEADGLYLVRVSVEGRSRVTKLSLNR